MTEPSPNAREQDAPCHTCGWATPVETSSYGPLGRDVPAISLRCDWAPEAAVNLPHWFTPGMRLCDLARARSCDAWKRRLG